MKIRLGETNNNLRIVHVKTVAFANLTTPMLGTDIPNANITVYNNRPTNLQNAVQCTNGSFVATDDTSAKGCRKYIVSDLDLLLGPNLLIFNGANGDNLMYQFEKEIEAVYDDQFAPAYFGLLTSATLTTTAFSTDRTETVASYWLDALVEFLTGPNTGVVRKITGYNGTTKVISVGDPLPATPTNGNAYRLITR